MMPLTNLDLLKHPPAKYHLPTTHERQLARLRKLGRQAAWKRMALAVRRIFGRRHSRNWRDPAQCLANPRAE